MPEYCFYKGKDADFAVIIEDKGKAEAFKHGKHELLNEVVEIYKVFVSRQRGLEDIHQEALKEELENEFGTHKQEEVIEKILKHGEIR